MVLKKLKPGMTVYKVKKAAGLATFNGKWQCALKKQMKKKKRFLQTGMAASTGMPNKSGLNGD